MSWLSWLMPAVLFLGVCFVIAKTADKVNKSRKEREDEIKKTPAGTVVDNLSNSDAIRGTIDQGRDNFSNTVRKLLLRGGAAIANLVNRRKR